MLKKTKLLRLLDEYGQKRQIPQSILLSVDLPLFLTEHVDSISYDTQNNILFANEEYVRQNKDYLNVLFLQKLLYVYLVHDRRLKKYDQFVKKGQVADYVANIVSLIEINQFIKEYGLEYTPVLTYDWFNAQFQTDFPTNTPAETLAEYIIQYAEVVFETGRNEKNRNRQREEQAESYSVGYEKHKPLELMSLHNNEEELNALREMFATEILEVNYKLKPDKVGDNLRISNALKGRKLFDTAYMTTIEANNLNQSLNFFEGEYKLKREVVFRPLKNALTSLFSGDMKKTYTKIEKRPYLAKYRGIKKGMKKTKGLHRVIVRIDISTSMKQEAVFKAIELAKEIALSTKTDVDVQGFGKYVINNKKSISQLTLEDYSEKSINRILKQPALSRLSNKKVPVQFDDLENYDAVIVIGDGDFAWGDMQQKGLAILLDADKSDLATAQKVIPVVYMKTKDVMR